MEAFLPDLQSSKPFDMYLGPFAKNKKEVCPWAAEGFEALDPKYLSPNARPGEWDTADELKKATTRLGPKPQNTDSLMLNQVSGTLRMSLWRRRGPPT